LAGKRLFVEPSNQIDLAIIYNPNYFTCLLFLFYELYTQGELFYLLILLSHIALYHITLLIIFIFYLSNKQQDSFIDNIHHVAQFIWVFGNLVWAYGEFYYPNIDDPYPLDTA
jgi:hypothetical protein